MMACGMMPAWGKTSSFRPDEPEQPEQSEQSEQSEQTERSVTNRLGQELAPLCRRNDRAQAFGSGEETVAHGGEDSIAEIGDRGGHDLEDATYGRPRCLQVAEHVEDGSRAHQQVVALGGYQQRVGRIVPVECLDSSRVGAGQVVPLRSESLVGLA